jgi:hypothetical protein
MLCAYPIPTLSGYVPCRQCMNCRINRQRIWAARILIESMWHACSSFITLTYSDDSIPEIVTPDGVPMTNLQPSHLTRWLKQFRNANGAFRFFAVGEYGNQSQRAHYHAVVFGISPAWEDRVLEAWEDPDITKKARLRDPLSPKVPRGFISIYDLNRARAAYVAQYTTKKLTNRSGPLEDGRNPEFSRQSTRPGLAAYAVPWLRDQQMSRHGSEALAEYGDVFTSIRIDGRVWPLGDYLRRKLREACGVPATAPERAAAFGRVYRPDPDDWASPLPEDYCPETDLTETMTQGGIKNANKEKEKEIPTIRRKAEISARRKRRRTIITQEI